MSSDSWFGKDNADKIIATFKSFEDEPINYREVDGDLIKLAKEGMFDVIAHGCNCMCTMGAGIAPQMAGAFDVHLFPMEHNNYRGDINKLGTIDYQKILGEYNTDVSVIVVNAYTQYKYGRNHKDGVQTPVDYEAITMCMRKMNHVFAGKHIGLPRIGAGLAGGDWQVIKKIIFKELTDCKVTVVNYKP